MNSSEWVVLVTVIALALAKGKTKDEIAFLAALFGQLSSVLTTLAIAQTGTDQLIVPSPSVPSAVADIAAGLAGR